jgi:hydrogenase maturation protein HypF
MPNSASPTFARRYELAGRVQGLGVRPSIARLAAKLSLTGHVSNDASGVTVIVEGPPAALDAFGKALCDSLPGAASVERLRQSQAEATGSTDFIVSRETDNSTWQAPLGALIPPDRCVCDDCLLEVFDPVDRRFRYPFTSCSLCGPRYSILATMPYERRLSSMAAFPMCAACQSEHDSAVDRRFHAQTICCPTCGPRLWLESTAQSPKPVDSSALSTLDPSAEALERAVSILRTGGILALRGVGGYQLVCDAQSDATIERLRQRKCRPTKPLAVMVRSLAEAERLCHLNDTEREALTDAASPIVLVRARGNDGMSRLTHPGVREVGVMLPTTPLHAVLLHDVGRPLVVTSGNSGGAPLTSDVAEAREDLRDAADAILHHNREVEHRIDDSVVRVIAGRRVTFRLARGFAPLPLALTPWLAGETSPIESGVAALGGHQKSAIAVSNGRQAILGPHLGDLDSPATRRRFRDNLHELTTLVRCEPKLLVHDLHPDYFSSRFAAESGLEQMAVQHHHAHVVAVMIENGWLDREVLGIAFDGTGYGLDGTIWGGEVLRCSAMKFQRVAHLRPFRLPGAEQAVREPWRVAVALLSEARIRPTCGEAPLWEDVDPRSIALVTKLGSEDRHTAAPFAPKTSSVGRLFDAAAALILDCTHTDEEEGRPAMMLESACDDRENDLYRFDVCEGPVLTLDWSPMIREVLADRDRREEPGRMAMRFHRGLAEGISRMCEPFPGLPVVLAGGVFQNRLLTEFVVERLHSAGRTVGLSGTIPPNDGGLAAGQLAVALARLAAAKVT